LYILAVKPRKYEELHDYGKIEKSALPIFNAGRSDNVSGHTTNSDFRLTN
jgi:hypothetical protein